MDAAARLAREGVQLERVILTDLARAIQLRGFRKLAFP
jgi:hypothetical protein